MLRDWSDRVPDPPRRRRKPGPNRTRLIWVATVAFFGLLRWLAQH
ncbi:hypothetical protein [Sphingomonas sp. Leaf17]|nr:hypothetical protein [Sphingomonas sp. Leaf17]